jgi:hypothetical protein
MTLAVELRRQYRDAWLPEGLLRLLCDRAAFEAIMANKNVDTIVARWQDELADFERVRARYLLY